MKKTIAVLIAVALLLALLAGCKGATFSTTSVGNKSTIEVNNADDGAEAQIGPFSVG